MNWSVPMLLCVLALGSLFSYSQGRQSEDPFTRFQDGVKLRHFDNATTRFAAACKVDLSLARARYAVKPGDKWITVIDLVKGMDSDSMATDFFSVVTAWKYQDEAVVELWSIEGDAGGEARALYCFHLEKTILAENSQWSLPITNEPGTSDPGWGYEQRWTIDQKGKYVATLARFVDGRELPIAKPKLEPGEEPDYKWMPKAHSPSDLDLPVAMFR